MYNWDYQKVNMELNPNSAWKLNSIKGSRKVTLIICFFKTLNSITRGKIVNYTGDRVKLPSYKKLTENDIIQVTLNAKYSNWAVQGETYAHVRI